MQMAREWHAGQRVLRGEVSEPTKSTNGLKARAGTFTLAYEEKPLMASVPKHGQTPHLLQPSFLVFFFLLFPRAYATHCIPALAEKYRQCAGQ